MIIGIGIVVLIVVIFGVKKIFADSSTGAGSGGGFKKP